MSTEVKLPSLGENIESGDVVNILVSEGEQVGAEQPILELETDKAIVEVPAGAGGLIEKIHVRQGDKVSVGQVILSLAEAGSMPAKKTAPARKAREPEKPEPVRSEAESGETPKEPGRKAAPEGRQPGAVVDFSRRAAVEEPEGEASVVVPASPSVRRLAREIGVDISHVPGSGPKGRISAEDVKTQSRLLHRTSPSPAAAGPTEVQLPDFTRWGEVEVRAFSRVRQKTAEHLARCWSTIPHVTQHDECDVTELEALRQEYSGKVGAAGGKLTITAIVMKFVAAALKVFPQFNASIDIGREEIVFKKYTHVGIAVDTARGLLVPVVRNVDRKNITELAIELRDLAERARNGRLTLEEMQGGTFTITNLGGLGGTAFTPIVNWPEVAILGLSRSSVKPVYRDGSLVPRSLLPLSLSYDHRLIDGADAARFLRWLARALEEPFVLSLEG